MPSLPDPLPPESASPTAVIPMPVMNLRIGRAPDNDLVLDDPLVSRYHAELRKRPAGGYEIADLGSQNGTFVNGRRIATQPLTDSDTVGIVETYLCRKAHKRGFLLSVEEGHPAVVRCVPVKHCLSCT